MERVTVTDPDEYRSVAETAPAGARIPAQLVETARTEDEQQVVMGVRHGNPPPVGVQFHPESILTVEGIYLVENFLRQHCVPGANHENTHSVDRG